MKQDLLATDMAEGSVAKRSKLARYASPRVRRLPPAARKCKQQLVQNGKDTQNLSNSTPSRLSLNIESDGAGHSSRGPGAGCGGARLTPLEEQVMQLKRQHPGLLLMVQNAYMYTFFGEDAEVAANVLKVSSYWSQNFLVAVVPITRLSVHVHRLVQAGYKVGVVNQVGACNVKPQGEKHAIFQRKLISVYSKGTLVSDDINPLVSSELPALEGGLPNYILCIAEQSSDAEDKLSNLWFGLVAFDPTTGDAVCDDFSDGPNRCELDKRLAHLQPVEVLVSEDVSENTERLLNHRHILMDKQPSSAFSSEISFSDVVTSSGDNEEDSAVFQMWKNFHSATLSSVAVLLQYLKKFGLNAAFKLSSFRKFTDQDKYLQMDGSTLRNLEIFSSKSNTHKGSLCWVLDQTVTKFGSRLLREWISRPLRELRKIQERQEAVQEIMESKSDFVGQLKQALIDLPDIERGLSAILNFKCSPWGVCVVLESLNAVHTKLLCLLNYYGSEMESKFLKKLLEDTFQLLGTVNPFLRNINKDTARSGDKRNLLLDYSGFPDLLERLSRVEAISHRLEALGVALGEALGVEDFQFASVSGQDYLVDMKAGQPAPNTWRIVSQTKTHVRYRTPEVDALSSELSRLQEDILSDSQAAWFQFLQSLNSRYFDYKTAVRNLATVDVLSSLAKAAKSNDYCRPSLVDVNVDSVVFIEDGRHPIMALSSSDDFVANSTSLKGSECRCMTLSGPNMGGKSSYIRQVALLAIMAQIGSFVPAKAATFSIFDAIFSRMGAEDQLMRGRSTLLVELQEASAILGGATARSLVLVDELGRGTGSSDGTSLAWACLRHLVAEVKCLTLFVTHFPDVMQLTESLSPLACNYHVEFLFPKTDVRDDRMVVLLYSITRGLAEKSFGLNAARLAAIPESVLDRASTFISRLQWNAGVKRRMHETFKQIMLMDNTKNVTEFLSSVLREETTNCQRLPEVAMKQCISEISDT
ncbi:DNA mismatch repair protein Msh3-like isoform X2 [Bacillus rossius redtenbacheri]|uniref:DNA mismatch repair protein Msh3-like isoform X2 n=1 Tax=Bacillus rossius redtenbacheri TaxID=93214 RepID=UPI002FDEB770